MQVHDLAEHVHHEDEHLHDRGGERRTRWVVAIAAAMMVAQLAVGSWTGSVALQTAGWHMGTHVGALGLTLAAYWYARTRVRDRFSFGTGKIYALAGYTSGVLLVVVALLMVIEGGEHLVHAEKADAAASLPVAALGFVVNLVSSLILGHRHGPARRRGARAPVAGSVDFNLRAAYIHLVGDALTSLLTVAALALDAWAGMWYLDPLMGLVGGAVIAVWAVNLCRQASRQLLDVVSSPHHERVVRERLEAIDDVRVADLHVWELGPGRRSCIVSLVTARPRELSDYRNAVLAGLDLAHLTIEVHRCPLPHDDEHAHTDEHAHAD